MRWVTVDRTSPANCTPKGPQGAEAGPTLRPEPVGPDTCTLLLPSHGSGGQGAAAAPTEVDTNVLR